MDQKGMPYENDSTTGVVDKKKAAFYTFRVTLFSQGKEKSSIWLPARPNGFYRVSDDGAFQFLSVEGRNGQWYACCARPGFFKNVPPAFFAEIPLTDSQFVEAESEDTECTLFIEALTQNSAKFKNYTVHSEIDISIGSQKTNDICFDSKLLHPIHAILSRKEGKWFIKSCDSTSIVFVNGRAVNAAPLVLGDSVFIMGLRILIGTNFISVNSGREDVNVSEGILRKMVKRYSGYGYYSGQELTIQQEEYFNRAPRRQPFFEKKSITLEAPPVSMERSQMPLLLRMGSSAVMSGKAALSGNYTMLLSSLLFPILGSNYTENQRKEYENKRTKKYSEYLEEKRKEIIAACAEEEQFLNVKFPDLSSLVKQTDYRKHIWERRPQDDDFLVLRTGYGQLPSKTEINCPERHFELDTDPLEEKMYQLTEEKHTLKNVPITICAIKDYVCGISGQRNQTIPFIRQLIAQIAFFHSYDEVKLVLLLDADDLEQLDFVRYLPHVWDDQKTIRYIATNETEAGKISEHLHKQFPEKLDGEKELADCFRRRPYYVVFATSRKLLNSLEIMKSVMQSDWGHGVSIFAAFDELPKECRKIINLLPSGSHKIISLSDNCEQDVAFSLDYADACKNQTLMSELSNLQIKAITQGQGFPKAYTFMEMFSAGKVEHLNPIKRWNESNPARSLTTPVGIAADGSLFMLDLHEKAQGPHGLVAGMTGSGKSEFLITYILSMAVNYRPDEVAFVLIDYKGGGLADAFENPRTGVRLPHLVGTITNLDGASINRSLMSINSELVRRQKVFSNVSKEFNEGSMNIYTYQKLYRAGKVSEPMPHLFIVSDEFAELKQQQPEFMDELISAARIGRSLGVHLILATQKPSGVVNDQIRSNTKFRVCLRVQESADSMDMLKRPEAAELTDTGRFYLQVGYNEYFAMGQSAWCGAEYEQQDTAPVQRDDSIEFLDATGQTVAKATPKVNKVASDKKQVAAVVQFLSELAETYNICTRQLWKPELPRKLDLEMLEREYPVDESNPMSVTLGLLDDPENQMQFPMQIDFKSSRNMLVIGGSGKTVLLQNVLFLLSRRLAPREFNFYILDYSSRVLKQFKPLPHCGAVLQEEDAGSLDEFFKLINSLIKQRKRLFSELEVDSFEAALVVKKIPLILVVIDNLSGLAASKEGEKHSYKLQSYLKDSANYGIKYVVTCGHLNEVPSRIRQELGDRISLHMKNKYDYSDVLDCKVSYLPPEIPGRGLVNREGRPLEFQCAIIRPNAEEADRVQYIKEVLRAVCTKCGVQSEAVHLPVFSETAPYEDYVQQFKRGRIPLGYSQQSGKPVALPLKQFSALSVYFGNPLGTKPIIDNILYAANREKMDVWIVKRQKDSIFEQKERAVACANVPTNAKLFESNEQAIVELRELLYGQLTERNDLIKAYCESNGLVGTREELYTKTFDFLRERTTPVMLLIESFADFCETADDLSALIFNNCFNAAQRHNIYVVGCFEPEDNKQITKRMLYYGFNQEGSILLFGGQFDKQDVCLFPRGTDLSKLLQYNVGLMRYQKNFHSILMPCGELLKEEEDEDEQSIF